MKQAIQLAILAAMIPAVALALPGVRYGSGNDQSGTTGGESVTVNISALSASSRFIIKSIIAQTDTSVGTIDIQTTPTDDTYVSRAKISLGTTNITIMEGDPLFAASPSHNVRVLLNSTAGAALNIGGEHVD